MNNYDKFDKLFEFLPTSRIEETQLILQNYYPWIFLDKEDIYPLEWVDDVLRFKEDCLLNKLYKLYKFGYLDLNKLSLKNQNGQITNLEYRQIVKRLGYSLGGYEDLQFVKEWIKSINNNYSDFQ